MNSNLLPLGIKNRTKTELPALVALEAIGQPWFTEDHRCDLLSIAMVAQLMTVEGDEIQEAARELMSVLGADVLDIEDIRPLVVMVNGWIQQQPNGRVQTAIDILLGCPPKKSLKTARR